MADIPYMYDYANAVNGSYAQSMLHTRDSMIAGYYRKYLLQKAMAVFEWKGLPDSWDRDYFLYTLYCTGRVGVLNTDKFGVITQGCALEGYDINYRPAYILVTNPLLKGTYHLRIGSQCEVFKLQADYSGILDMVGYYADMLANAYATAMSNMHNSKLAFVFFADKKQEAESFKKMFDSISAGEPAVSVSKKFLNDQGQPNWTLFTQNVGQNYILDKLLSDMRKIESMFDTDVGIPNANTDKKERLITDEVNSNNIETRTKCDLWLEELKLRCKKVNAMFGTHVSVDWRYREEMENNDNGARNGLDNRGSGTEPRRANGAANSSRSGQGSAGK